jgi:enoyl-CoA hydratase/carnithine racemase
MLMTGDPITAQEAHRLGMVNQIHPADELLPAAHRIAAKIACNSGEAFPDTRGRAHHRRLRLAGLSPGGESAPAAGPRPRPASSAMTGLPGGELMWGASFPGGSS